MSYDINIAESSFNYTSNMSRFFARHIGDHGAGGGILELNGVSGRAAADRISLALDSIHSEYTQDWRNEVKGNPIFHAKYDAPNGWGSATSAIIFLARLMAACYEHPRHKVRIHA